MGGRRMIYAELFIIANSFTKKGTSSIAIYIHEAVNNIQSAKKI